MTSRTKEPVKSHRPTLMGLAAVADATGLSMLSNTFLRAHDEGFGVYAERLTPERSRVVALGVIDEAIKVWKDAEQTEGLFGSDRGEPMGRIKKALSMLDVARAMLGSTG